MTMIDVLDETLRSLGATDEAIKEVSFQSIAMNIKTQEQKDRINRELTPEEVEKYRALALMIMTMILHDPEFAKRLMAEFKQQIENN